MLELAKKDIKKLLITLFKKFRDMKSSFKKLKSNV